MTRRPEVGVCLGDAAPLVAIFQTLFIEDYELIDIEQALPDRDKVTAYFVNHGSFIAPFPAPMLTVAHLLERGGFDDLVALTLFHKVAEFIPGLSPLLQRYFGHSTNELQSVSDLIEMMKARKFHMIGTAPESWSSIFTWDDPIGPLRKVGLLVAALEADADIVLAVQKGMEVYGRELNLPWGARFPGILGPRGLLLPVFKPLPRARIRVKYERFKPSLTFDQRARLTATERRAWNQQEFVRVRRHMIDLYRSIPAWDAPAGDTIS